MAVAMITLLVFSCLAVAVDPPSIDAGRFSAATPGSEFPSGWKPLTFNNIARHTMYSLVNDDGVTVIRAVSNASASALAREMSVDVTRYPVLAWRWKIANTLDKGDMTKKSGDDYPARIYVTFQYDPSKVGFITRTKFEAYKLIYGQYPPASALNYIWESRAPKGTIGPSPYTEQAKLIVIESGTSRVNEWVSEERNVYEDYKKAFGTQPPLVSGVAIMTDTDNTRESAVAHYGDIMFRSLLERREGR